MTVTLTGTNIYSLGKYSLGNSADNGMTPRDVEKTNSINLEVKMIGNILLNVRYLLAPILIIVAGAGVLLGGIMAWLGVVLLFVGLL